MKHHQCQIPHRPDQGKYGDCLRACIASLLNVENVLDVPHFAHDGRIDLVDDRLREHLALHRLNMALHAFGNSTSFDEVLEITGKVNPGIPYLLFCNNGEGDHAIIIRDGAVFHDPSWFRVGPYKPLEQNGYWVLGVLTPIIE